MSGDTYIPDWTEDQVTNDFLDRADDDSCHVCETEPGTIESDDGYICQSCHENKCEAAEMAAEDLMMDRAIDNL